MIGLKSTRVERRNMRLVVADSDAGKAYNAPTSPAIKAGNQ
jgi:hypothetical protein